MWQSLRRAALTLAQPVGDLPEYKIAQTVAKVTRSQMSRRYFAHLHLLSRVRSMLRGSTGVPNSVVLWCLAIRHAVLTGVLDIGIGLHHIDADRREKWASRLDVAEALAARKV